MHASNMVWSQVLCCGSAMQIVPWFNYSVPGALHLMVLTVNTALAVGCLVAAVVSDPGSCVSHLALLIGSGKRRSHCMTPSAGLCLRSSTRNWCCLLCRVPAEYSPDAEQQKEGVIEVKKTVSAV